jgi:hypothetical protein
MIDFDRIGFWLFLLAFALIVVAYHTGASDVLATGITGINKLGLTFSGRNQKGEFANYPAQSK